MFYRLQIFHVSKLCNLSCSDREMKVAVVGCTHGRIETIYETISHIEQIHGFKVDLLLCCGDFQALRNEGDFASFACPKKYQELGSFYKYYSGEKTAPVLTLVVGGNHEASNFLQELPYGGWLAPNIYYLGYAGVVNYGELRIAGISGIFSGKDYHKAHFEHVPYDSSTKRSVYHLRSIDILKLLLIDKPVDIVLTHDWPSGVQYYGNIDKLMHLKPYAADEIKAGNYGAAPLADVLQSVKPRYWFAAHYHVKFAAYVKHQGPKEEKTTQFLALDKCVPKRSFLQIVNIDDGDESVSKMKYSLEYDPEWLAVLQKTDCINKPGSFQTTLPKARNRNKYKASEEVTQKIIEDFGGNLAVPLNFTCTAPPHGQRGSHKEHPLCINHQTQEFCQKLHISDPNDFYLSQSSSSNTLQNDDNKFDSDLEIVFE